MSRLEVEPPEIEVDESSDPFKRRVALIVAVITFFASVVGYMHIRDSNLESSAARLGEQFAIDGIGAHVKSKTELRQVYGVYIESALLERQAFFARSRSRFASGGNASSLRLEAQRLSALQKALADLSPLLKDEQYTSKGDPQFPNRYFSEKTVEPRKAQLRELAQQELVEDYRAKAADYVVVLTVLAGSLFLLGLSLAVGASGRRFLFVAGVGLAVAAAVWTWRIGERRVRATPPEAIKAVAEGDLRMTDNKFDEAIAAYSRAIRHRPDYGIAYVARARAHFVAGSPQDPSRFLSITEPDSLRKAIADRERAAEIRGGQTVDLLWDLGFNYFLAGRYQESIQATERAIALNDDLATLWFNLGLAQLARNDTRAADRSYERAIRLALDEGDDVQRGDLMASARTDLELLIREEPERASAAQRVAGRITASEAERETGARLEPLRPNAKHRH